MVAGVVAEKVTACTEVDVSSAVWHEVSGCTINEDFVFGFGLVVRDDIYGDVEIKFVEAVQQYVGVFFMLNGR